MRNCLCAVTLAVLGCRLASGQPGSDTFPQSAVGQPIDATACWSNVAARLWLVPKVQSSPSSSTPLGFTDEMQRPSMSPGVAFTCEPAMVTSQLHNLRLNFDSSRFAIGATGDLRRNIEQILNNKDSIAAISDLQDKQAAPPKPTLPKIQTPFSTTPAKKRQRIVRPPTPSELPIFLHGTVWKVEKGKNPSTGSTLIASEWRVYYAGEHTSAGEKVYRLVQSDYSSKGKAIPWVAHPPIYGESKANFIGLSCFVTENDSGQLVDYDGDSSTLPSIQYAIDVTPLTPANTQELDGILQQLAGISPTMGQETQTTTDNSALASSIGRKAASFSCSKGKIAAARVDGGQLPSNVKFTLTATAQGNDGPPREDGGGSLPAGPPPTPKVQVAQDGNASPPCLSIPSSMCTPINRTIEFTDREVWDISMAVSTPGVTEPQYAPAKPNTLLGPTTHTDLYALFNLYPLARYGDRNSFFPHLSAGIPITGRPFYRPFFGLGENVTGWKWAQSHLPIQISFIAGLVYMKEEVVVGNGSGGLVISHARTLKGMYGVEIPIMGLISKISAIGAAKTGK